MGSPLASEPEDWKHGNMLDESHKYDKVDTLTRFCYFARLCCPKRPKTQKPGKHNKLVTLLHCVFVLDSAKTCLAKRLKKTN